jgi:chromosome segregation ATPase|tara:strand:+ start:403 stop:678 length:276 start_codon:yes stop_codon:yes gene_type:complete
MATEQPRTISTGPTYPNESVTGEPLVLTKEATELDIALDELQKVCKRLCDQLDDLTSNIKRLTDENQRLKDALGIVEFNPLKDLEDIVNGK